MQELIPKLYLCATPIGNLEDVTLRVLRVLKDADAVYCEDTRHTVGLLNHFEIKAKLVACHEHNERQRAQEIAARVLAGERIAYVSDAGMPCISDPGEALVQACIAAGAPFEVLPGASAPLTALALSGFPTALACFVGFLPRQPRDRRTLIQKVARHAGTLIFYESPLRVGALCAELETLLGDRPACLARELTKLYEEAVRGTLASLALRYADTPPKGECVLVVGGAGEAAEAANPEELLKTLLKQGMSAKDAAKHVSALTDLPRNDAYRLALSLTNATEE